MDGTLNINYCSPSSSPRYVSCWYIAILIFRYTGSTLSSVPRCMCLENLWRNCVQAANAQTILAAGTCGSTLRSNKAYLRHVLELLASMFFWSLPKAHDGRRRLEGRLASNLRVLHSCSALLEKCKPKRALLIFLLHLLLLIIIIIIIIIFLLFIIFFYAALSLTW